MGLFLALSGVVGSTEAEVVAALTEFARRHSGHLRPAAANEDESTRLVIALGASGHAILYPSEFLEWETASEFLSIHLRKPTFSFHIHDGDLWMFHLYVDGRVVTAFNPIPDYWGDLSEEESALMRGDASVVAQHVPRLSAPGIERYLVPWDLETAPGAKAYPEDEFEVGVDWQLLDFMRKLGFVYPMDDQGRLIGDCYSFRANRDAKSQPR